MKQFFEFWDWENAWLLVLLGIVLTILSLGFFSVVASHRTEGYYLVQPTDSSYRQKPPVCIYRRVDWEVDGISFCTPEINEALEVLKQLNATVAQVSQ